MLSDLEFKGEVPKFQNPQIPRTPMLIYIPCIAQERIVCLRGPVILLPALNPLIFFNHALKRLSPLKQMLWFRHDDLE